MPTAIGGSLTASVADDPAAEGFRMRVVGQAVLEPGDANGQLGTGAVVSQTGLTRLSAGADLAPPFIIAVRYRPGAPEIDRCRTATVAELCPVGRALNERRQALDPGFGAGPPVAPTDLLNFGQVDYHPFVLGGVLSAVALLVLVHLLVTSVRRRRRDLAILKTVGFTRGEVSRTVAWQAATLTAVVLALGVPLGVAVGRWI